MDSFLDALPHVWDRLSAPTPVPTPSQLGLAIGAGLLRVAWPRGWQVLWKLLTLVHEGGHVFAALIARRNVLRVHIPPLRERKSDLLLLAREDEPDLRNLEWYYVYRQTHPNVHRNWRANWRGGGDLGWRPVAAQLRPADSVRRWRGSRASSGERI